MKRAYILNVIQYKLVIRKPVSSKFRIHPNDYSLQCSIMFIRESVPNKAISDSADLLLNIANCLASF
jgi:hypothetical protein